MTAILLQKLKTLEDEIIPSVSLATGRDLTTPPQHPRISFPFPDYTPVFQVLNRAELGGILALDLTNHPGIISELKDVSSSSDGVCLVTSSVFGRWNAHAGSHADQPKHWLAHPPFAQFDDRQYQGNVTILNLASALALQKESRITVELLQTAAGETDLNLQQVRRLILRTYEQTPNRWDSRFAFLDVEAGWFLGELPNLVLLGTDAPSVDHPGASPIDQCAHGGLWAGRVAILEGLETNHLPKQPRLDGVLHVVWNPMQQFEDAKGASVWFFESRETR